ncbi:zinc-binding alcohol dehydrogenase family protein [Halodesulfovibrio sp.]|jgi:zinc-binding alcohol dehydrogenase family protein|uniref:zinc-binding alcohol dehydrogenase family protein n=1 Tax=Halodesulfovibrio sp. TaxID=1912772 RepID=UPI0025E5C94A|nr:zinc-binding alcohol dehydrogenase family protein [Halodesulfovibrio sp.]MCT4536061.1 zinc-binding alcohol dehydrogenase family protein [Halodesulfovibrio sp.]MCT4626706.1 zinc-binding alcohol dehydrogenase family protein [Halodesulfovibrio sp.]
MLQIQARGGGAAIDSTTFSEILGTMPTPKELEVLVKVSAASINPVDTKMRMRTPPKEHFVPGMDTCGIITEVGSEVTNFKKGDRVFFMGQTKYSGSFAQYQLADARTIALAPDLSSDAEAAALPVATFTAYDALFTRLGYISSSNANAEKTILIIGGAGGVGSMAIQLAKWAGLTVIATASREETAEWCKDLGADYVINHNKDMDEQVRNLDMKWMHSIFCTTHLSRHWASMAALIRPQGSVVLIDDPEEPLDIRMFKTKSVQLCWEFALVRTMYETSDMHMQGFILAKIAQLIDTLQIRSPLTETHYGLTVANVQKAHVRQESNAMVGKQAIIIAP